MSRLMSVALTWPSVVARRKTVTRRRGWLFAKPGDRLTLCEKVMGRTAGDPLHRLAEVEIVSVRRERLDAITLREIELEGLAGASVEGFIGFFREHMGGASDQLVTRIEWRYL